MSYYRPSIGSRNDLDCGNRTPMTPAPDLRHGTAGPGFVRGLASVGFVSTWIAVWLFVAVSIVGCGQRRDDAALDSDANGYVCLDCKAKFYTDRTVFANYCPSCQKPRVEMVVGFVCPADGQVTYAPRGRGAMACGKCGKVSNSLTIPRESELKAWGAEHKTAAEVGVQ